MGRKSYRLDGFSYSCSDLPMSNFTADIEILQVKYDLESLLIFKRQCLISSYFTLSESLFIRYRYIDRSY